VFIARLFSTLFIRFYFKTFDYQLVKKMKKLHQPCFKPVFRKKKTVRQALWACRTV